MNSIYSGPVVLGATSQTCGVLVDERHGTGAYAVMLGNNGSRAVIGERNRVVNLLDEACRTFDFQYNESGDIVRFAISGRAWCRLSGRSWQTEDSGAIWEGSVRAESHGCSFENDHMRIHYAIDGNR